MCGGGGGGYRRHPRSREDATDKQGQVGSPDLAATTIRFCASAIMGGWRKNADKIRLHSVVSSDERIPSKVAQVL